MSDLLSKKCVPCEGHTLPLDREEIDRYLPQVKGWDVLEDDKKISRDFSFKDFKAALEFINQVGKIAEKEGHHPDIYLHGWNKVRFDLSTHAIGGLSENDFIMAAKINELLK